MSDAVAAGPDPTGKLTEAEVEADRIAACLHDIGGRAARGIVQECIKAKLSWSYIAITCETVLAIVVLASARQSNANKVAFAEGLIQVITDRARRRVRASLCGQPHD